MVYTYISEKEDYSTYIIYGYHYFKKVIEMSFRRATIAFNVSDKKFVRLMFW